MNAGMKRSRVRKGFTLVELLAVMVVLAILAGVAVPKYFNYVDRANTSATQGTLGGVRAGLANFFTNAVIEGTAAYPTLVELQATGTVMQEAVPQNPFSGRIDIQAATVAQATARTVFGAAGWNYYVDNAVDPPVATFYCNSSTDSTLTDPAGGVFQANEL